MLLVFRLVSLFVGLAVSTCILFSQEVKLSPVPLWLNDDDIPEELKEYRVFLKPESQEIVVLPDSDALIDKRKRILFELHNQARVNVTSHIAKSNTSDEYSYDYIVNNSAESRRPLERWSLLIPPRDDKFIGKAAEWDIFDEPTRESERPAHRHIPFRYLHFRAQSGKPLAPGDAITVQIKSANLPGYIQAVARSKAERELSTINLEELPEATRNTIAMLAAPEWDGDTQLVIGPRFLPDTPKEIVASSFQFAIHHFVARRKLSLDSPFVAGALSTIELYTNEAPGPRPRLDSQAQFLAAARTSLEIEIAKAMRLSLSE